MDSNAQVITVGYDAPQSSLIFYRYDMWIQRADTNTVKESSGRFWGLVVGDISTQRSTILSIDHSIVHHISKAETPHPINILGSSDNFEGLKLSNLFNLMGLSQKLEHQISIVNHGSSSFYQYTAITQGILPSCDESNWKVWTFMVMIPRPTSPKTWHEKGYLLFSKVHILPISNGLNFSMGLGLDS